MYKLCVLDRPATVNAAVKLCSKTEFPNVHVLFRIACTIPVTSCECARTAKSSLRRIHPFTRASMARDRLSSLALIHIHYDMKIDLDEVVTIFSVKNHAECNSQIFCVNEVLCSTLESVKGSFVVSSCYTFECCTVVP